MGNIFDQLKKHVFNRRKTQYAYSHSQQDHPERVSVDQSTTNKNVSQESNLATVSSAIETKDQAKAPSNTCSDFYLACRSNDLEKVRQLLPTMTLDEIDRMEPNGSTALHAACYHGHIEIVKLLLETGADRAVPNKYQCLPYDEARNDEIKELFFRVPNGNRLIAATGAIEWDLVDDDALEQAVQERHIIKSLYDNETKTTPIEKMFEKIEKNYIGKGLINMSGIDTIQRFFQKATKELNPIWIIKAYTAETDFYRTLNHEIAAGASQYQNERRYIIALISHHPLLEQYNFIGNAYRVIKINNDDLKKYQINCVLMTKSFLSSSIDRKVTELFAYQQELKKSEINTMTRKKFDGTSIKTWVLCKYTIKHHRTALHIENSSQYANEGEILIMPYSVFKVKQTGPSQHMTEIELEECDNYL